MCQRPKVRLRRKHRACEGTITDIPRSGCYQCSQRRIHCDRTQPSCGKCVSKGILCSGFGVRYKFCDGSERMRGRGRMGYSEVSDGPYTPSAAYMDESASTGNSSRGSYSKADYGTVHSQSKPGGLHPALPWRNSEGWERFLVKYCAYTIS
jgi:hypothetical protein